MSKLGFIYSELWPTCHLPDEWKMSSNAKRTKNDFLGNSQVKCVSRLSNKNFYLQSHKIFYQIFIKPTKMPNKTCWIINNNNLPPFCASLPDPDTDCGMSRNIFYIEMFSPAWFINYFWNTFLKAKLCTIMGRFFLKTGICDRNMFIVKNDLSWHLNWQATNDEKSPKMYFL